MNLGLVKRDRPPHDPNECRDLCCWRAATLADFDPSILADVERSQAELAADRRQEEADQRLERQELGFRR